ncbi:hypothetical protein PIB30_001118 [Stylosanthes scabra]|uniref:Uncharacterized protein n=1 Tax=Stylosanthes scabra TaxID=79078 RepID=A0ABU6U2U0_9FABA|nr:hypothetical protein [Stylosanthes scabra]
MALLEIVSYCHKQNIQVKILTKMLRKSTGNVGIASSNSIFPGGYVLCIWFSLMYKSFVIPINIYKKMCQIFVLESSEFSLIFHKPEASTMQRAKGKLKEIKKMLALKSLRTKKTRV